MFRRPVFAVVDELFREGQGLPRNQVFRLSPKSRNELLILAALAPSLQSDLRVQYDNKLYCMDASPFGGAVCEATIGSAAAQELGDTVNSEATTQGCKAKSLRSFGTKA